MPLRKKCFAVLAAGALVCGLVGCQRNDVPTVQEQTSAVSNNTIIPKVAEEETGAETKSETTTAPQNTEINIETLAEGEERDWSVEDVLKNDLLVDGISISIPCTLSELLEILGDDYSVKKTDIKDSINGKIDSKFKDFTGEFIICDIYYNGERTFSSVWAVIADPQNIDYDTIKVIGYRGGLELNKAYLSLPDLTQRDSLDKCLKIYGKPNEVQPGDYGTIYLKYCNDNYNKDDGYFILITIENGLVDRIWAEYETEDL